jgi:divalent metal cation (Fe/Co/Zn/Cd) transporter
MTLTAKALLAYLVVALIVFAWMFRFEVLPSAQSSSTALIADRWLGTVQWCFVSSGGDCAYIYPPKNSK